MHPLRFPNSGIKAKPAGATPAGTVGCDQPAGATLAGTGGFGQPAGAARGHTRLQRDAHKVGRLQGVLKGLPPTANPTISKGGSIDRRVGRPLVGWLSMGKGIRRLRRGSSGDGADGARGVKASF
ncbi:hypothetical protein BHE74_00046052 [Ensete ventricosum]|nr:hypothetical protein BHE74_00046052 [Ensete ventricosum]